jgi:hypothetical protein
VPEELKAVLRSEGIVDFCAVAREKRDVRRVICRTLLEGMVGSV